MDFSQSYCMLLHINMIHSSQAHSTNDCHVTTIAKIVDKVFKIGLLQPGKLRSQTSTAVPHPIVVLYKLGAHLQFLQNSAKCPQGLGTENGDPLD